jgi:predicted SnoaL-like aldol condensation-catalyzing enzyme/ketosteroid isomerase-like protein
VAKDVATALSYMDEACQYRDDPFQTELKEGKALLAKDFEMLLRGLTSMKIESAHAVGSSRNDVLVLVRRVDEFILGGKSIRMPIGAYYRVRNGKILEWLDTPLAEMPPPPPGALPPGAAAPGAALPAAPAMGFDCSADRIESNKALARLFDLHGDPQQAYEQMAPDYIQHNPIARRIGEVNGVSGRDEFKLLLDLKNSGIEGPPPLLPGQPPEDPYHHVMADCDHVFLLKKVYLPDPQHPGKFYEAFNFDFWRIEDGKLAEHWDGTKIPPNLPRAMTTPYAELLKQPRPTPPGPAP